MYEYFLDAISCVFNFLYFGFILIATYKIVRYKQLLAIANMEDESKDSQIQLPPKDHVGYYIDRIAVCGSTGKETWPEY
jgi:hypothetical protein